MNCPYCGDLLLRPLDQGHEFKSCCKDFMYGKGNWEAPSPTKPEEKSLVQVAIAAASYSLFDGKLWTQDKWDFIAQAVADHAVKRYEENNFSYKIAFEDAVKEITRLKAEQDEAREDAERLASALNTCEHSSYPSPDHGGHVHNYDFDEEKVREALALHQAKDKK